MDSLLYGHNPEERIVAVQQLNDQTIRLFKRVEGKILHKDVEFFPFFFLADDALIKDFPKQCWLKELAGNNFYRFIAAFSRWSEMWEAVHFILSQYNKNHSPRISSYQELKEILIRTDPVRQFLLQSGITLFKGMEFDEVIRLYIDVQIAPPSGKKRGGKNYSEQILLITLMTNGGDEYVFKTIKHNEQAILKQFIQRLNKIDPDVIEGCDIFGTILPALGRACERQQIPLAIGRDGSDMRAPAGFGTAGFGESEWFSYDVFGRHLVDTLSLTDFESSAKKGDQPFNLYSLARHLGIPVDNRPAIPQNRLIEVWDQEPKRIADQSVQNVRTTSKISNLFLPSIFYLAQMCPFNFKMLIHTGATARIESLMLREYVHNKHSIPKPPEGSRNINIPSEIFQIGIFADVSYIELEGMHSSIILLDKIIPKADELNVFQALLKAIHSLRQELLDNNRSDSSSHSNLDVKLKSLKHLLYSFHLHLGTSKGLFSDPDQAETIISKSKDILKEIIHQIELFNATIIHLDGQGFFLLMPDNIIGEENRKVFTDRLSKTLPEGIHLVPSYYYTRMLSYRRSNYAVLDQNNNVFIKGNGLISRGMERFLRVFTQRFIECLLTNDLKRLHHTYASAYTQITGHKWTASDFCRTDFVRMDTETYQKEIAEGQIAPSPVMEAAVRSSFFVKPNTRVSYYITGNEVDIDIANSTRLIEEWNPSLPDENTAYYLDRLLESVHKFREFFEPTAFERIISLDEMFGFSEEGIHILTRKAASDTTENKPETDDYSIWLAESE